MFLLRLFSSTKVSGQTRHNKCSFVTSRPACSTRIQRVSNALSWSEISTPLRITAEHRLIRNGVEISLQLKAFETLCILVEQAGRLVTKEHLLCRVWPDTLVEENNLNKNISLLRKALGESATGKSYIET